MTNVVAPVIPRTGGVGLLTASVSNAADGANATDVSVPYTVPDGATFDDTVAGASPGCTGAGNLVTCALGNIDAGTATPFAIGVRVAAMDATTLYGTFGQPTSDQWDPNAGEIRYRTWYHEADGEGVSAQVCWPVTSESPNMDIERTSDGAEGRAPRVGVRRNRRSSCADSRRGVGGPLHARRRRGRRGRTRGR